MKIDALRERFAPVLPLLRCPACGAALRAEGASLVCEAGHTFDLSSKGYVNFAPGRDQRRERYDAALFESRGRVLADGFYAPVAEAVAEALAPRLRPGAAIADAGCGEGYYARFLSDRFPQTAILGLDLSRDAIQAAARGGRPGPVWMVADLKRLPVRDGALDALLDVLTPADYETFRRVLRPGGVLVKAIPADDHLMEIRQAVAPALRHAAFASAPVESYLRQHMRVLSKTAVRVTRAVTPEQARDLLRMTPLTFGVEQALLDAVRLPRITVSMEVYVGES